MAKSKQHRRKSRRGSLRTRAKSHISAASILGGIIAVTPVAVKSYDNFKSSGGGINGVMKGILPTISTSYTGYNPNDGKFYAQNLVVGYVPLIGGIVATKLLNKVGLIRRLHL